MSRRVSKSSGNVRAAGSMCTTPLMVGRCRKSEAGGVVDATRKRTNRPVGS